MTDRIAFSVPGPPRGKARPRASARVVWQGGQPIAVSNVHSDPAMVRAEGDILKLFRARHPKHEPWTGPVMLRFTAIFEVPASWPKKLQEAARQGVIYHTAKPDKDNIEKLLVDALNGWAFMDDAQIQGGGVKRYGSPARLDVELISLAQPDLPATPSIKRAEQRKSEGKTGGPTKPRRKKAVKAQLDPKLQAAIDAADERDRRGRR